MALHTDLPIYRVTYELLNQVMNFTKQFKRDWRDLGRKLNEECLTITILVYRANSARDKRPHLSEMLERLKVVELMLRLSHDNRLLSVPQHAKVIGLTGQIGKQATGWRNKSASPAA